MRILICSNSTPTRKINLDPKVDKPGRAKCHPPGKGACKVAFLSHRLVLNLSIDERAEAIARWSRVPLGLGRGGGVMGN